MKLTELEDKEIIEYLKAYDLKFPEFEKEMHDHYYMAITEKMLAGFSFYDAFHEVDNEMCSDIESVTNGYATFYGLKALELNTYKSINLRVRKGFFKLLLSKSSLKSLAITFILGILINFLIPNDFVLVINDLYFEFTLGMSFCILFTRTLNITKLERFHFFQVLFVITEKIRPIFIYKDTPEIKAIRNLIFLIAYLVFIVSYLPDFADIKPTKIYYVSVFSLGVFFITMLIIFLRKHIKKNEECRNAILN